MASVVKTDTITGLASATTLTLPTTTKIGATAIVSASAGSATIIAEGGTVVTNIQQGLCKWWVRHQGSATLIDSFNNASITDNGTGDFSHGFTNDFRADNAYAVSGIAQAKDSRTCEVTFMLSGGVTEDGLIRYETGFQSHLNGDATAHDCDHTHVLAHGDLA